MALALWASFAVRRRSSACSLPEGEWTSEARCWQVRRNSHSSLPPGSVSRAVESWGKDQSNTSIGFPSNPAGSTPLRARSSDSKNARTPSLNSVTMSSQAALCSSLRHAPRTIRTLRTGRGRVRGRKGRALRSHRQRGGPGSGPHVPHHAHRRAETPAGAPARRHRVGAGGRASAKTGFRVTKQARRKTPCKRSRVLR